MDGEDRDEHGIDARLRDIEARPLDARAEAYERLREELRVRLEEEPDGDDGR